MKRNEKPEVRAIKREIYCCRSFMKKVLSLIRKSRKSLTNDDLAEIDMAILKVVQPCQMEIFYHSTRKEHLRDLQ